MSIWPCPTLPPGTLGLPGAGLMLPQWTLVAHLADPTRAGFCHLAPGRSWAGAGPAARGVVLDLHHAGSPLLLGADRPAEVDVAALQDLTPDARDRGGVRWMIPLGLVPDAPGTAQAIEAAHRTGEMWVITGEVPLWWQTQREQPDRIPDLAAGVLFPEGSWAAVVPLLAQPDEHGVGTRPADT